MTRVLVVDDDRDINFALQAALTLAGYTAQGAETGAAALAVCAEACPELVLLDHMLPDLEGTEVCRRLRAAPATARVPVVFLTARNDEATRVRGLVVRWRRLRGQAVQHAGAAAAERERIQERLSVCERGFGGGATR
jgi:CheY-like chemotaxis protein